MMKMMMIAVSFTLLSSFTSGQPNLFGNKWILDKINMSEESIAVTTDRAYLTFEEDSKRIGGNGSCNRFGGSFSMKGDSISFGPLISTKMYCADVQGTEDKFLATLQKVNRYELNSDRLVLLKDDVALLEFHLSR